MPLPLPTQRRRRRHLLSRRSKRRRPVNAMAVDATTVVDCAKGANALASTNLKNVVLVEGRRRVKRVTTTPLVWRALVDPAVVAEIRRHLVAAMALLLVLQIERGRRFLD